MTPPGSDYDVVIVGAGPAGSAAAISALRARPSARVVLLDRSPLGRDKVCGDGITSHAVAELQALGVCGVLPEEKVAALRFTAPGGASAAAVTCAPLHVVPRSTFDERLARAAIDAGAEFVREKVTTVARLDGAVAVNGTRRASVVIAADGSNSVVRRLIGLPPNRGSALAVAVRGYAPTPPGAPDELLIRWDRQPAGGLCYAWAFPTSRGTTNVGYGMSTAAVTGGRAQLVERMRALLPEYAIDGLTVTGHTLPLAIWRPPAALGRVLLVGDAASLINPFTGEGIYSAIVSGAMAGAAAMDSPSEAGALYRQRLARRFAAQHRQMRLLYPLINSGFVLNAVIRTCQRDRRMFDRLVEVSLGERTFSLGDVARFSRHAMPPTPR